MEKVKHKLRDLSILSTFVLFAVVFLLLAMLLVEVEKTLLANAQRDIAFQYSEIVEGFNSVMAALHYQTAQDWARPYLLVLE